MIKRQVFAFALRHLIAVTLLSLGLCFAWTALYAILLVIAALTNGGVGGPLAYPGGLFFILASSAVVGMGIFVPACAVGLIVSNSAGWPRLAGIPVVLFAAALLAYVVYGLFIDFATTHARPAAASFLQGIVLYLSIPLGIYWWITAGTIGIAQLVKTYLSRRFVKGLIS